MHVQMALAPGAAAILRFGLAEALLQPRGRLADIPDSLAELEAELGIDTPARAVVGTAAEVSGWFQARYMLLTARGLRALRPEPGDVVAGQSESVGERVVSSIGNNGRVYLKGQPTRSAWPNHLNAVSRVGSGGHDESIRTLEAALLNAHRVRNASMSRFAELEEFALPTTTPPSEAVRALEELLESGEREESPFQRLIEEYPQLLASTVVGHLKTFVIPQQRLGAEHVPDFLVLGISSLGPQWVTVEIEAPRHSMLIRDGGLSGPARHAVQQIEDWRSWLTLQVAYAQGGSRQASTGLGLYGITNTVPGLVIIGRDDPTGEPQVARARSAYQGAIDIRSWDWVLRHSRAQASSGIHRSEYAIHNAREFAYAGGAAIESSHPDRDPMDDFDDLALEDTLDRLTVDQ